MGGVVGHPSGSMLINKNVQLDISKRKTWDKFSDPSNIYNITSIEKRVLSKYN